MLHWRTGCCQCRLSVQSALLPLYYLCYCLSDYFITYHLASHLNSQLFDYYCITDAPRINDTRIIGSYGINFL